MSLIREALDRARRESATPPPRLPGGPNPWSRSPRPRSLGWPAAAALIAAAGLGGAAAWWGLRPPPAPVAAAPEAPIDPQPLRMETLTPQREPAREVPADSPPVVLQKVPADSPPAPSPPLAPLGPAPLASRYVGEIPLPEGGTLSLDGVVSSATNPVAVINGRLLSPGDIVLGFEVLSIGATQVELRRDGRVVTLALR